MSASNYPPGVSNWTPGAPWNDLDPPEKEFGVVCSQTLSKSVSVVTDHYIPGVSGVDYESDGEGGICSYGWQDPDDTSDINWGVEYEENGHYTPLELIKTLKEKLEKELKELEAAPVNPKIPYQKQIEVRKLKHLIQECGGWTEDELEIFED